MGLTQRRDGVGVEHQCPLGHSATTIEWATWMVKMKAAQAWFMSKALHRSETSN